MMFVGRALTLWVVLGSATAANADSSEWGAIATGAIFDTATKSGSSAFSIRFRPTKEAAERTALAGCQAGAAKQIPHPICTLNIVWNRGCEYAVIGGGRWPTGQGVASVGVGTSSENAQTALYSDTANVSGFYMHSVKGGCLDR
jgi:hypothetical protein